MRGCYVAFQPLAQFVAVHYRHHYVADNQVDWLCQGYIERLLAVGSGEYVVVRGEYVGQQLQHFLVVLYEQNRE